MSRASREVGLGPGARRVSPSLDPGLREGRVAESGPGPGPRATLAGGGAGGACRRRRVGTRAGVGVRRRVSEARETGPEAAKRRGRARGHSRARSGAEKRSAARLSASGDLGLTKPRGEWGAGRRWTLRLMFLGAPFSHSALEPSSGEVLRLPPAQGQRCRRDTKVRNDASLRGHQKGPVLRRSRSLSFAAEEVRDQVSHPQYGARLKLSHSRSPFRGQRLRETRWAEAPRPCAHRAVTGSARPPPRTPTPPTLSASQAHQALASPGSLSHFGTRPRPAVPRPPCLPAAASLLPVLARSCGPGGWRSQRAGSGPAPRRLRSPWWELGRGVMSVRAGCSLDLGSRALSGRASPGSQSQPPLPPRLRGGKQCDRPELWAGPQPPRPPPGGTRLRPASGAPQRIQPSQAGRTPPSRHLSANSILGAGRREHRPQRGQAGRLSWRDPRTVAETRTVEGSLALTWRGPGKEEHQGGQTDRKPGDLGWAGLGWAVRAGATPPLSSPRWLWLLCSRGSLLLPRHPLYPQLSVPLSSLLLQSPLISPHVPPLVHLDPNKGGLAGT